jgi:hypothetical protein
MAKGPFDALSVFCICENNIFHKKKGIWMTDFVVVFPNSANNMTGSRQI